MSEGSQLKLPLSPPGSSARGRATLPYQRRVTFLSPAEITYYRMLQMIYGDRFVIMAHVRVLDLCDVVDRDFNQAALTKIDRRRVDFVLCDPKTFSPVVAIELDDASHDTPYRRRGDAFLDEVFRVIGLRLVRQRVRLEYTINEVAELVSPEVAATV